MPRPKPPQELKVRSVRLTDTQWAKFDRMGGAAWMRRTLDRHYQLTRADRAERDRRVRIDRTAGLTMQAIADRHHITRKTVSRILRNEN